MPPVAGKQSKFQIGTVDVKGINDMSVTVNGDILDVTTFLGNGWVEKIQGLKSAEISVSGFYLSDDATGQTAIRTALLNGTTVAIKALLDGTTGWSGNFMVTSFEDSATVDGAVERSISLESTGAVTVI